MTENENNLLEYYERLVQSCVKQCDGVCNLRDKECECVDANVLDHLREFQEYRAIGTVEEFKVLKDCGTHDCMIKHLTCECSYRETGCSDCKSKEMIRTAVERMKPKKVAYQGEHKKCPACGSFHVFGRHCTECGQAVDYD